MNLLDGYKLPDELIWQDEHEWSLIRANVKRTIQGKHIIREKVLPSETGRSITLFSDYAWIPREDDAANNILGVNSLRNWSDELGKEMTLNMQEYGKIYLVRFRHWEQPVLVAESLIPTAYPTASTQYNLTLRLSVI